MSEIVLAIGLIVLAAYGAQDLIGKLIDRLTPWFIRCGDNIARKLSPCPVCEGDGGDPDDPGAICPRYCAAVRRNERRMRAYIERTKAAAHGKSNGY